MRQPTEDPLQAIEELIAFSSKDWGATREGAWLYAIVCGWDDDPEDPPELRCEAMEQIADYHEWDEATVARLRRLHEAWKALAAYATAPRRWIVACPHAHVTDDTSHGGHDTLCHDCGRAGV